MKRYPDSRFHGNDSPAKNTRHKLVIGVTGGIATGKSTVSFILKQLGAKVVCCDAIAHRALWKNTRTYREIVRHFGKAILDARGAVDRKKLGSVVFRNKKKRQELEGIVHPFVFRRLHQYIRHAQGVLVIEVPLLYETQFQSALDGVLVVACEYREQVKRMCLRDACSRTEAAQKIKSQMPLRKKIAMADWVVNNSSIKITVKETQKVWKKINQRAKGKKQMTKR